LDWVGSESCWVGLGNVKWTRVHLWGGWVHRVSEDKGIALV